MEDPSRSAKRRRVSTQRKSLPSKPTSTLPTTKRVSAVAIPRSTSPDELAGDSDEHTYTSAHRRQSSKQHTGKLRGGYVARGRGTTHSHSNSRSHSARSHSGRSHSEEHVGVGLDEDSPDELDHTVHTFYRGDRRAWMDEEELEDVDMLGVDPPEENVASRGGDLGRGVGGYAVEEDEDGYEGAEGYDERYEEGGEGYDSRYEDEEEGQGVGHEEDEKDEEEELKRRIESEERRKEREKRRVRRYKVRLVLRGHRKGVAGVKFSPDGKLVASCSADATIRIWDAVTGKQLHVLEGHLAGISTIAWGPDSRTLASGSDDKSIWLWNAITGKPYPTQFLGHHNYIYSIAFSPKGNMIVSGSYDEAVFLWDVRGARVMRSLPAHSDPVGGVDFVRDGTLIVSCAGDGLVRIWDTATGQCLRTLVHEDNAPVSSVRFSPNGKFVLAWTLDSCVRLWNYVEGRAIKTYQGHQNKRFSIGGAFGTYGDGSQVFVASGSEDGAVVLWDVTSKKVLQRLEAHSGVVLGVDTMGGDMATCGVDGTVRLWRVDEGDYYEDGDGEAEKVEDGVEKKEEGDEELA